MFPRGERILVGGSTILPAESKLLDAGWIGIYLIQYTLYEKIRNCDSSNTLLSTCVNDWMSKKFPDSPKDLFKKWDFYSNLKMSTLEGASIHLLIGFRSFYYKNYT